MPIESLLWPESVVIVGASSNKRSPGGMLIDVFRQYDFGGRLYAVNPRGGEVSDGITAYPSLESLPEVPDLCLIVVAAEHTVGVLETCRRMGMGAALVYAAPTPENPLSAETIRQAIAGSTLRVAGPNSVGFLNVAHGLAATWSPAIDLGRGGTAPADGSAAIVAQSGGLGFGMLSEATRRGLGVRYVASTGNEADVDCVEVARCALADTSVTAVLMFVEGLVVPLDLVPLAHQARQAGKSIVFVKAGSSVAGQEASALHTAHLAGSDVAYDAVFQEYGIVRARDSEEMIDYAMACTRCPPMTGRSVGIATYSGGAGVWVADACEAAGLHVPPLESQRQVALSDLVKTYGSVRNPVDLTGPTMSPTALVDATALLADEPSIDAVVVISPMAEERAGAGMSMDNGARLAGELAEIQRGSNKPILMFTYTGAAGTWSTDLARAGIAWYTSPVRLATALRHLADSGTSVERWRTRPTGDRRASDHAATPAFDRGREILLEHEVKGWLRTHGIRTTREILAGTATEAQAAATQMGPLVAMKAQAAGVIHKSALGLVKLGVGPEQVASVFQQLWADATKATGTEPDGVLVQEMAPRGFEMIVGTITDPDFGPLVMVGAGGMAAEQIGDRMFRLAPVDVAEATNAIHDLRMYRALERVGRHHEDDWPALAELVAAVSTLAWEHRRELVGVELNPVVVLPQGEGVVVLDGTGEAAVGGSERHE